MDTKSFRHELHRYPELPLKEHHTAELIAAELDVAAIDYRMIAESGILARVEGRRGNHARCVVLHANMGGMAVEERTGAEFSSRNEGVMHAEGNDCHVAMLLGVLKSLQASRDFEGTLFGLFQPGNIGCEGAARQLLIEDPFKDYNVAAVISAAVDPELEIGEMGFCPGRYAASLDMLRFKIKGVGGGAACRSRIKDTVVAVSDLIMRLSTFNSEACVVLMGRVVADGLTDTLPDVAKCEGVMRAFDEKLRQRVKDMMVGVVQEIEYKHDVEIEAEFTPCAPCVENDKHLSYEAMLFANSNGFKVRDLDRTFVVSDFGCYAQKYPSLLYRVGVGREAGNLLSATFLPDDRALEVGEDFMNQLALNILNR